jgi:class 3 adenylate cyclase
MRADEPATLRLLTSCREITDRLLARYRGRIANTAGDSVLAEFASAVDALQCGLEIQDRLAVLNEEVPDDRRVRLRIGLHVGEVMVRNGDLLGDSVNVAARLQALAPPSTICLSETAHHFTSRSANVPFEDLGLQLVKNLDAPVRAYLARPAFRARAEGTLGRGASGAPLL